MSSKAFIILGNQLFPTVHLKDYKDHIFFMAEDYGLCTYVKHHKQKILLFLSTNSIKYSIKQLRNKTELSLSLICKRKNSSL